jgi:hypothetical protein
VDVFAALLVIAEGRGSNPSDAGGILIIAGIVLAVAVLGFVGHWLIDRGYMKRGRQSEIFRRKDHKKGRVGRIR